MEGETLERYKARLSEAEAKIADLEALVKVLAYDETFGVTQRPAIQNEMRGKVSFARHIVFADVDKMHEANDALGYEEVNRRISKAVNLRFSDVLLRARWFSGDELVFVLTGNNPEGFCKRLSAAFKKEGLSVTALSRKFSGNLESDVAALAEDVKAIKMSRASRRGE